MGYQPDLNARNLKRKTSAPVPRRISVIMARAATPREDPFFSQCLEDLSAELLHSGFQLGETAYPEEGADRIPAADGYIVLGKCRSELLRSLGQDVYKRQGQVRAGVRQQGDLLWHHVVRFLR